jgi:cobalamin biosynthesis Mg chelatase CobN
MREKEREREREREHNFRTTVDVSYSSRWIVVGLFVVIFISCVYYICHPKCLSLFFDQNPPKKPLSSF